MTTATHFSRRSYRGSKLPSFRAFSHVRRSALLSYYGAQQSASSARGETTDRASLSISLSEERHAHLTSSSSESSEGPDHEVDNVLLGIPKFLGILYKDREDIDAASIRPNDDVDKERIPRDASEVLSGRCLPTVCSQMRPWGQRLVASEASEAICARFANAGLPEPPLHSWQRDIRRNVLGNEAKLACLVAAPGASQENINAEAAGPVASQREFISMQGSGTFPSGSFHSPHLSGGQEAAAAFDDDDDALFSMLLDGDEEDVGHLKAAQPTPPLASLAHAAASPSSTLAPSAFGASSLDDSSTPQGCPCDVTGEAANGMWLQRYCSLMEACDMGHGASLLLVHLLEVHAVAQAAKAASTGEAGPPPGRASLSSSPALLAQRSSPLADLDVPEGVLFSCLEAWKDR